MNRTIVGIIGPLVMLASSSAFGASFEYTKTAYRSNGAGNAKVFGALDNTGTSHVSWMPGQEPSTSVTSTASTLAAVTFLGTYRPVFTASTGTVARVYRPLGGVSLPYASASYSINIGGNIVKSGVATPQPIPSGTGTTATLSGGSWSSTKTFYTTGAIPLVDLLVVDLTVNAAVKGTASYTANGAASAYENGRFMSGASIVYGIINSTNASTTAGAALYAEATAAVSAGVDLWVLGFTGATAGITLTVDLLKATSSSSAQSSFKKIDAISMNRWTWNDNANVTLSALSGKMDAWVKLSVFGGGVYSDSANLINWSGINVPIVSPLTVSGTQNF